MTRTASTTVLASRRHLALAALTLGVLVASPATAVAAPRPNPSAVAGNVIVVLRDQHTDLAARKGRSSPRLTAFHADQSNLIADARSHGVKKVRGFDTLNGVAATVTATQAAQLAADPNVAAVYPDLLIQAGPKIPVEKPVTSSRVAIPSQSGPVCPADPAHPLLQPEALQVTNTAFDDATKPQAHSIVDGAGVKVAFIADGLDINNPDFIRADGTHVFVDYQDFSGDGLAAPTLGAEAFGDASSIAAQGRQVYDLANFVNPAHPLPPGCNIRIEGVSPGASLVGLKVFGQANSAPTSRFIEAIDYAVTTGVDVLNESFGGNPFPDTANDPITLADNAAIAAGVTVVSSTGDAGTQGTIGSPASSTGGVIGVAATTTFQSYAQSTYAGFQLSNGSWISNNISSLSSGGITHSGGVPDISAPGDLGWALCTPDLNLYAECTSDAGGPSPIQNFGGTSQSSPLTAGGAALVIEAYRNAHGGHSPSPALVKGILTSTATDLGHPAFEQGSGLLNTLAAVQAAESWQDANGTPAPVGDELLTNVTQLKLSGNPGQHVSAGVNVTNISSHTRTVSASTRSFENVVHTATGSGSLNTATAPTYIDAFGIARSYSQFTFSVGSVDRLDVSAAAAAAPAATRIILLDPTGAYAAYSIPQGAANYQHVDVRLPKPGTWTAFFALSRSTGFNGSYVWRVDQTDLTSHGKVSPSSMVLGPGQTGHFTVKSNLPGQPSDLSASVQFSTGAVTTSLPMTLRADIPTGNSHFTGTITGGNGRQTGGVAQSNVYFLNVPKHVDDLSIGLTFSDPGQTIFGFLTAPDGQVYSFQSNIGHGNSLQITRRDPQQGQWMFSLEVTNPVSGLETNQTFDARVRYDTVRVHASGLPNGNNVKLTAGVPVNVPVTVRNTGVAPEIYFADARLDQMGTIPLAELSGNATFDLPQPPDVLPFWLVPTEATELDAAVTADQPVNMDFFFQSGDPDVYSPADGNGASVQVKAAEVSPGLWATDIGQTGPFSGPATPGTANVAASVIANLFDPAVTSSTGDFWQVGVDPSAAASMAAALKTAGRNLLKAHEGNGSSPDAAPVTPGPLVLDPGESGTILVTITPQGNPGTKVSGTLYIDTVDLNLFQGDELIALPYAYKIK